MERTPWHSCGVACHMIWDHTRHKWTHPALTPARQASTRLTYLGGMEGWVDLGDLLHIEMVYLPTDGHSSKYKPGPVSINYVDQSQCANQKYQIW